MKRPPARQPSLLIIEQGFLKPRRSKPVHGVEIFRLHLIRQLAERGVAVTVVAEKSWQRAFDERLASLPVTFALSPPIAGVPGAGLIGTIRTMRARADREPFDVVMFGNARMGLIPAMFWSSWFGLGRRYVLFAHRHPGTTFLDAVSSIHFDVIANSEWVAESYRGQVSGRVDVSYGLPNADRFYPPDIATKSRAASDIDRPVNFVLLGRLPHVCKGLEEAIEAFKALPPALQSRCRLHLASYINPPDTGDPNIIAYPWMPSETVPDFLRSMDVMLALSTIETFSQAIVQGMLTELPIVATDIPVFVEKLDPAVGGAGGFITRGVPEVTSAMERLAQDPALRSRMGAEGRRVALERYVWNTDDFIARHLSPAEPGA